MRIRADLEGFRQLPDEPGKRIHALFAGLYLRTTECWLGMLRGRSDAELAYHVIPKFYDAYRRSLDVNPEEPYASIWRRYRRLAARLTIASPISSHLL